MPTFNSIAKLMTDAATVAYPNGTFQFRTRFLKSGSMQIAFVSQPEGRTEELVYCQGEGSGVGEAAEKLLESFQTMLVERRDQLVAEQAKWFAAQEKRTSGFENALKMLTPDNT